MAHFFPVNFVVSLVMTKNLWLTKNKLLQIFIHTNELDLLEFFTNNLPTKIRKYPI